MNGVGVLNSQQEKFMTTKVRLWIAGVMLVAVSGLIYVSGFSYAGEGDALKKSVMDIGDLIKKGDHAAAKTLARDTAKKIEDLSGLMLMFKPRYKGGIGVGKVPVGNDKTKDGIEVKLRDLARDVPPGIAKEAAALEESGYWIAAMAELAKAKGPETVNAKKTKKAWDAYADDMRDAGLDFAKAAAAKGAQQIKTAAAKVNATCSACHNIFKE
jgi:hypothetical protein